MHIEHFRSRIVSWRASNSVCSSMNSSWQTSLFARTSTQSSQRYKIGFSCVSSRRQSSPTILFNRRSMIWVNLGGSRNILGLVCNPKRLVLSFLNRNAVICRSVPFNSKALLFWDILVTINRLPESFQTSAIFTLWIWLDLVLLVGVGLNGGMILLCCLLMVLLDRSKAGFLDFSSQLLFVLLMLLYWFGQVNHLFFQFFDHSFATIFSNSLLLLCQK